MTDLSRPMSTEEQLRETAIKRLEQKRDFRNHLFLYVVINSAFWVGWIIDGAANGWEFPWPVFPMVIWGLLVLKHANDVFWGNPLREELVQREVEALRTESHPPPRAHR